jgi:hypothetical protein
MKLLHISSDEEEEPEMSRARSTRVGGRIYLLIDIVKRKVNNMLVKKKSRSSTSYSMDYSNEYWRDDLSAISFGSLHDIFHPEFRHKAEQKNDLINFEKKELRRGKKGYQSIEEKIEKVLEDLK